MNFEAVPCMLRTGADGSSVYGLLIRPSAGVVQQQQQLQPQSTVILQHPTTSGQQPTRALQLVPSGAIQQQAIAPAPPHSSTNNKILLPHVTSSSAPMHLQLATAPLGAKFSTGPHVTGISVVHSLASYGGPSSTTAPVYSAPNVFDSPSPSQVVPQMSVSDGYEHAPVTSSVVSTAQPTTQHVYMQPLMEQYDYAQQPLTSSSAASYPKPTASASLDVSGLELLDDLAPMDIARILAESESILSPDCPMLEGAVVDTHSSHSYNPMHQQHMEQPQASCSSAHLAYSVQQQQQVQSSSSRAPLNIQVSCQQQQLFPSETVNARMPACRYLPQQQQHLQQQQQQLRPALSRRNPAAPPPLPGIRPALRPQLDWEQGPNDSSGTPDSGIQSIAGSPPSNGVYTPPLMSPSLRNNSGHQARRSSGPPQISPTARTSSSTRPPPCLPPTAIRTAFDNNQCAVDERPTSSSSSTTTTSKEHHRQSTKRVRRRKKRKGEFADMPRLFPAFRKTVDSSPHDEQVDDEECANVPVRVNVGDKLSQMEAKFEQVCSRLDSALEKRSTDICSPTVVSTDLCSPTATNTSPSTASGPPSTSISLDCEDPTALAERLLSLKPDLIEQVANIIQSKTKCKDEQMSSVRAASTTSGKEKRSKPRRPSSPVQSPSTDATSDEKKKLMLDRLRQYRQKARRIVDTRLLEHIIDLSSQLRTVHIGGDQSLSDKSAIKSNWFSVNLEKVAHRIARRKRPASTEIGLENEAESGDDAVLPSSSSQLVVISEHPRRISLKIKRGAFINAEDSVASTPKKCQNPETYEEDAETRRTKKRRKKPINPWDRKVTKKRRDSPVADDDDGAKLEGSPSEAGGTSKDVTGSGSDAICKVVLRRLSDERKRNDNFCVVSSAESQMDYYYSSPSRKTSLKSGQTWSPTHYESETCALRFDGDALQKCCQSFGRDFRLPYDIWAERRPLVSPVVRKSSTDYRKIRSNIYIDQPPRDEDKQQACSCPPGAICAEDCLNRMMFVECSPGWCPCDETCTNRRFQRHQFSPFAQKFETTDGRGCGVRASGPIDAGTFIFEYVGEVVTTDRFAGRMSTWYSDDRHHYGLDLCAGFVIDSYRSGNIARFVNHSCEPNCQMQKWNINGQYRVGLFALRDLEPGEELTYDYKFAAFEDDQVCSCGSAKCRGTISAARSKSSTDSSPKGWSPRPLSHRERSYVAKHRIFLLRIFDRNYKKRFGATAVSSSQQTPMKRPDMGKMIRTHLKALDTSSRTVQTRRLSVALEDECFLTLARLAQVLNQIYSAVLNAKDEYGHPIVQNGKKAKFSELTGIKELILTGQFETPEKFDAAMKTALEKVQKSLADSKKSLSIMVAYGNAKRDCAEQLRDVLGFDLSASFLEQTPPTTPKRQRKETARAGDLIPTQTDLSYMDGGCVVGSYDPDDATDVWAPTANEGPSPEVDNVRCICGMFEEDGVMVQCDGCLYWLHLDCVHPPDGDADYICEFCTSKQVKAPAVDILLRPQPEVKLAGCIYYRTLVNSNGLQIRLNETVYVKRLIDDHHKAILKKLHQQCVQKSEPLEDPDQDDGPPVLTRISEQQPKTSDNAARERPSLFVEYQRKDLRAFRVERLFKGPNGQRFVFGCYYARPHETFCEPTRMFCRNELFWTPLFDTLPLDAVVGRCLVLEPSVWCKGRPRLPKYREDDIFVCEYRVDKSQRFFEKIAQKNRYYINTERYIFDSFEERLRIKRNFTPFIMPGGASEHPVKIVAESDDEDLVPLGVIRLNLQKRKRAQMTQRLERIVQSIAEQNM